LLTYSTAVLRAGKVQIGEQERDGSTSFWGMVLPGKMPETFRLRGRFGTLPVKLTDDTVLGYQCFRSLNVEKRLIKVSFFGFSIPALAEKMIEKNLPQDLYVKKTYYPAQDAEQSWKRELEGGEIRFIDGIYATSLGLHIPTKDEPYLCAKIDGVVDPKAKHKKYYAVVDGKKVQFGLGIYPFVWAVVTKGEIKPYATEAKVFGERDDGVVTAQQVAIRPVGDPVQYEDSRLPRYMFIGDSISVGYNSGLRRILEGKVNLYHPPTNCGGSGKGAGQIDSWLGAHEEPGRGWDAISFNFGHWDAASSKELYQRNLEEVIAKLKNTGAELIFVTTPPVDKGYSPAGELLDNRSKGMCAPGRTHGVMEKYINPWALEVMKRHPEIVICDHWQIVKDGEEGLYKQWWHGKNVHFKSTELNAPLAQALADKVVQALARRQARMKEGWRPNIKPPNNAWE